MEVRMRGRHASSWIRLLGLAIAVSYAPAAYSQSHETVGQLFETSDRCVACHNGISTSAGEDISIGVAWRGTMMAHSARDPYWIASVRREVLDHPTAQDDIEDECSICHMPMARYEAQRAGRKGKAFAHFPPNEGGPDDRLAEDGVSCSLCHQITAENLGKPESFVGGFQIDETTAPGERHEYGPYDVDKAHLTIMRSSSTFQPTQDQKTIGSSELCATCHTLYTKALNARGEVVGELPEQVPYQEWLHSAYKETRSCQSCHMPVVEEDVPITSVLGEPRSGFSRHTFVGGNFFMQRLLDRYRNELGLRVLPGELDRASERTIAHLRSEAAGLLIRNAEITGDRIEVEIAVENRGGHKLPTAYPSRRVWLHVTVRGSTGKLVFESGALRPDGSIVGNDNDEDAERFERHYSEITRPDEVQIYESILGDPQNQPTTGLLTAVGFLKDNRLLPSGFDKATADKDIAVHGDAETDRDFAAGADRIRFSVSKGTEPGPFEVEVELWYQPISHRWAMNLESYESGETTRFVRYYKDMAHASGVVLARAAAAAKSRVVR